MGDLSERIDEVESAATGPQIGAFFDFDGTLIAGYSGTEFYRARLRARDVGPGELAPHAAARSATCDCGARTSTG